MQTLPWNSAIRAARDVFRSHIICYFDEFGFGNARHVSATGFRLCLCWRSGRQLADAAALTALINAGRFERLIVPTAF